MHEKNPEPQSERAVADESNLPAPAPAKTLFHPLSGLSILAFDWLLFSGNVATGGAGTPLLALAGFTVGGVATACIQRFIAGDGVKASLLKALGAGFAVGVPLPIAGTVVGGTVMTLSGLTSLRKWLSSGKS